MLTYKKAERLRSRSVIRALFESGRSFNVPPFRVLHLISGENTDPAFPLEIAVSAPKRNLKKAVSRNRVKRQVKEAFRKNKHRLLPSLNRAQKLSVMLVFTGKAPVLTAEVEEKIILILQRLQSIYGVNEDRDEQGS